MKQYPLYILAGGRSSRFGSDKALAELDGQSLIMRIAQRLKNSVAGTLAVADIAGKYDTLGIQALADDDPGRGPLGGLATAMTHHITHHGEGWLWLAACDWLEPDADALQPLRQAINDQPEANAAAYRDEEERWQPMPGLYHTRILSQVNRAIETDHLAMRRLLDEVNALAVSTCQLQTALAHANTPDQLRGHCS